MAFSDYLPTRRRRSELGKHASDLGSISSLQEEMNRMFDDFFHGDFLTPYRRMETRLAEFNPSIDVSETGKAIKVTAELPGMEEKDISVTVDEDYLIISGERKEEKKEEKEEYYHREMSYGSFQRTIPLNVKVDAEKVEATFKSGVLKIKLPKVPGAEKGKGKKIKIKS
jgi:HSP20 family protein